MKYWLFVITALAVAVAAKDLTDNSSLTFNSILASFANVSDEDLQKCVQSGNRKALETAKAADDKFVECYLPVTKALTSLQKSIIAKEDINLMEIAQEFCRLQESLYATCHGKLVEQLEPCLSDRDLRALKLYQLTIEASNKFQCADNAKVLSDTFEIKELMCISEQMGNLRSCFVPFHQYGNSSLDFMRSLLGDGCRAYKGDLASCIEKHLPCPAFALFVTGGIKASSDVLTPCPDEVPKTSDQQNEMQVLNNIQDLLKVMNARLIEMQTVETQTFMEITQFLKKILHKLDNKG